MRTPTLTRRKARTKRAAMLGVASGAALGAAFEYFLDPSSGRRRRRVSVDRTARIARRTWRRGARLARAAGRRGAGLAKRLRHRDEPRELDDATLAHKVETVLFRSPDVRKGQINVNAQRGVVQLRGELPSTELIDELVARTREVQGVRDVENLLHVPGTRAPMHT